MKHALPDGEDVVLGSLDGLAMQLRALNKNTLQLSSEAVEGRLRGGVEANDEFVAQAAHGLAVLCQAADSAKALLVPVRLSQSA